MSEGSAVLLAAGFSKRFGSDKRKFLIDGVPLLHHTIRTYKTVFDRVVVVIRQEDDVLDLVPDTATPVQIYDAQLGMSRSLVAGIKHVANDPWVIIGLADMPYVQASTLSLLKYLIMQGDHGIVRPVYEGRHGNPVAFSCAYFADLIRCSGDEGARHVLQRNKDQVHLFDVEDEGICIDIDSPTDIS